MTTFSQEWISPILEVFKKQKIVDRYSIILGLNPLGHALCRQLYEKNEFETLLVFNSPAFSTWNRYPIESKAPVVPVHGMVANDVMIIFGDVMVKEYDWVTDMLFYIRGNVPTRFIISMVTYDGPACGQVLSQKGDRLLKRMNVPLGRADFYDGITAPLLSIGNVAGLDPVILFLEESKDTNLVLQVDDISVSQSEIDCAFELLDMGLDMNLLY
ncbi:hypothetical protein EU527_13975 [Candidatus Thorarchaeota archaeon]|nr:MAG: hypothetical protein EU527_13975 [Candidatus Thorarchaeota archaeon]